MKTGRKVILLPGTGTLAMGAGFETENDYFNVGLYWDGSNTGIPKGMF